MQITITIINQAPPTEKATEPPETAEPVAPEPVIELTADEWNRRQQAHRKAA